MKDESAIDGFLQRKSAGNSLTLIFAMLLLICVGIFAYLHIRTLETFEARPRFIVLPDPTTMVIAQEKSFPEAKALHIAQAELAAQTLFNRGPKGLDSQTRAERLFGKAAHQKIEEIIEAQAPEFDAKNLHQKIEIASVNLVKLQDRSVRATVYGQLIRTGHFDGQPINEASDVKLSLLLVRNPSVLDNGRFPSVVTKFDIETQPISAR